MSGHEGHGTVTLSLTEQLDGGGLLYQSWAVCACTLPAMRKQLGPPRNESMATAEQVEATGQAVLSVDSGARLSGEGEVPDAS